MALVPVSHTSPFCTGQQFVLRFDPRPIGQLLRDDGTIVPPASVPNDPILLELLKTNSGYLEGAIYCGGRYTPADLAAIIANPLNNNQLAMLADIVAGTTVFSVYARRVNVTMPELPAVKQAMALREAFASGAMIFGLPAVIDAGRAEDQVETPEDVQVRNDPTWQARRMFGTRAKWRRAGSGHDWW